MTREEQEQLVTDILDIGESMLLCGAEVSRVENSITRLFCAYGAERTDVLTILSCIELTVSFPGEAPITRQRRILSSDYDTDLEKLEEWNALSRRLCAEPEEPGKLTNEIAVLRKEKEKDKHRDLKQICGYLLASGAFALFFGGTVAEGVTAAFGGLLIWIAGKGLDKLFVQKLLKTFLLSVLDGGIGLLAGAMGLDPGPVAAGCVMLLIPGVALTTSIRDTLTGDTISGALRMVEALVTACFVAAGLFTAMLLSGDSFSGSAMTGMAEHSYIQILTGGVGALGFAMSYRCLRKRNLFCTLAGALTWAVYLVTAKVWSNTFNPYFFAGASGTLFAEAAARIRKMPATVTLLPAIIPLVPGRSLYLAMEYTVRSSELVAIGYVQTTAIIAGAIAAGMVCVSAGLNSYIKIKHK